MSVWNLHMSQVQRKASDPPELTVQVVMSRPMWMWGTELSSSARAVCALKCSVISPAPTINPYFKLCFKNNL